jgi:membrane-associated phospholipid phosphatase
MTSPGARPEQRLISRITSALRATDVLVISFALLLSLVCAVLAGRVPAAPLLITLNLLTCAAVVMLALGAQAANPGLVRQAHDWYPVPLAALAFKEMHFLVGPLHGGRDYDALLIAADRWLFGTDPTIWMGRFAHPYITEILQVAYTSFYFLFVLLGIELYRRNTTGDFHVFMFTCVYGFFLSYLGYFLLPAVGPRFTLHDFTALNRELPGVILTPSLRWLVNTGGSVPLQSSAAAAMAAVQRDAFPSGHTMMTLVLMVVARGTRARVAPVLYAAGSLLIVATVYQRYHYVVDLLAGIVFMIFCLVTVRPLYRVLCRVFPSAS